jgi:glutamyl-tRNA reductase
MNNDSGQMQVDFHNKAKEKFFSVYSAFENAISNLNRKKEEYRFQQTKKQYAAILEQELQAIAKNVLFRHMEKQQSGELDQLFHQFIKDYLHRFVQKINAF